MKTDIPYKWNQKTAGIAIFISDKIDESKVVARDKEVIT